MLRACGESYREWEERGLLLPVTSVKIDYRKPAFYDDLLTIRTRIVSVTRLRLVFAYEVHCYARNAHIATATTEHVFMNKKGRPSRTDPDTLTRLSRWSGGK